MGAAREKEPDWVFYDGHCALCHGAVQFALKRDADGSRFRFSPLDSATRRRLVPDSAQPALPDSMVFFSPGEEPRVESTAVVLVLKRIGGTWGLMGVLLEWIPAPLRDFGYRVVARIRHRVFGRKEDACPVIPEELRARFEFE